LELSNNDGEVKSVSELVFELLYRVCPWIGKHPGWDGEVEKYVQRAFTDDQTAEKLLQQLQDKETKKLDVIDFLDRLISNCDEATKKYMTVHNYGDQIESTVVFRDCKLITNSNSQFAYNYEQKWNVYEINLHGNRTFQITKNICGSNLVLSVWVRKSRLY